MNHENNESSEINENESSEDLAISITFALRDLHCISEDIAAHADAERPIDARNLMYWARNITIASECIDEAMWENLAAHEE